MPGKKSLFARLETKLESAVEKYEDVIAKYIVTANEEMLEAVTVFEAQFSFPDGFDVILNGMEARAMEIADNFKGFGIATASDSSQKLAIYKKGGKWKINLSLGARPFGSSPAHTKSSIIRAGADLLRFIDFVNKFPDDMILYLDYQAFIFNRCRANLKKIYADHGWKSGMDAEREWGFGEKRSREDIIIYLL